MNDRAPARVLRETRRASLARFLAKLLANHEVTDREVERLTGVAHQHVAQWRDPDASRAMSFADAMALPALVRRALAELLVGPGHVIATIPDAAARASIAQAVAVQRETSDVTSAHLEAISDGLLSRSEATPLRLRIRNAMRELAALDHSCARAEVEGVVSIEGRH